MTSYGEVYAHRGKGHDRLYVDDAYGLAAVFDGAGGAELSAACVAQLPEIIEQQCSISNGLSLPFINIVTALDNLPEAHVRKSTVAMSHVQESEKGTSIDYFNAGDSSLYFLNKTADTFKLLAHTPSEKVRHHGQTYISTAEFLGARRSSNSIAKQVGTITLPPNAEWVMIGFSDGVQDEKGKGIRTRNLKKIISRVAPCDMPGQILQAVKKYDDAAVFVTSNMS